MTFVEYCKSKLEKATPDKACRECFGTGIDQHDTDPMGGSMNTPCHYCKSPFNFEEFARSAMPELVRRLEIVGITLRAFGKENPTFKQLNKDMDEFLAALEAPLAEWNENEIPKETNSY